MADHSLINPGPEPTLYDRMRHESMKLRPVFPMGTLFFVSGLAPSRWCECGCGQLKVWCPREKQDGRTL